MSPPRESSPTSDVPEIGTILAGKYRIEHILGKGGMGVVAAARHTQLGQRVAIKFLLNPEHEETVARFLREARAAVRLRSEHVARVLDVGQLETGSPYMVMEYLEGEDLLRHVRAHGPLDVADAVLHVLQTCEAIAEAHAAGIIHRDLKPANLFLTTTPDGETSVKVLDFGISKTNDKPNDDGQAFSLTHVDDVLGSPLYMPPEQLRSAKSVDVRSDIWSIGVILYQLLVGRTPWSSNVLHELVMSISTDPPPSIREVRQDVPWGLEAAIFKCLEKKRDRRFGNVAELAWAIAEFGPAQGRQSARRATRLLEAVGVQVQTPPGEERMPASRATATLPSAGVTKLAAEAKLEAGSSLLTVFKTSRDLMQRPLHKWIMAVAGVVISISGLAWYVTREPTPHPASLPPQAPPNDSVSMPNSTAAPDVGPAPPVTAAPDSSPPPMVTASASASAPDMTKTNAPTQGGTNVNKNPAPPSKTSAPNPTAPNTQIRPGPNTQATKENPSLKDLTDVQ